MLLLLIGVKFPTARKFFVEGFKVSTGRGVAERVFHALVFMIEAFRDVGAYRDLRSDIDAIKGTLRVHGILMYVRRLGLVKPTTAKTGIRLGVGMQRFRIQRYTAPVRAKIEAFLGMSAVLSGLPLAWSLQTYNANLGKVLEEGGYASVKSTAPRPSGQQR